MTGVEVSKQHVVDVLRRAGMEREADEADRSLPDTLDLEDAVQILQRQGITKDMLISRMGGSP